MNLSYLQNTFFFFLSLLSFYSKPIHILLFFFFLRNPLVQNKKFQISLKSFPLLFKNCPNIIPTRLKTFFISVVYVDSSTLIRILSLFLRTADQNLLFREGSNQMVNSNSKRKSVENMEKGKRREITLRKLQIETRKCVCASLFGGVFVCF